MAPAHAKLQNLIQNGEFKDQMTGRKAHSHLASKKPEAFTFGEAQVEFFLCLASSALEPFYGSWVRISARFN